MSEAVAPSLPAERLTIDRLGRRGEGVAGGPAGPVHVPYALAGETVLAEIDTDRGRLVDILSASADRIEPFCPYFGRCGGCAVQHLAPAPYAAWKHLLAAEALGRAGLRVDPEPLVDAHGEGRRRATFHARLEHPGGRKMTVGFMQARSHAIVDIADCPILAPSLAGAVAAARRIAACLAGLCKPLDIGVTGTLSGLDIDVRGSGALPFDVVQALMAAAETLDIARLSNHGAVVIERRAAVLRLGTVSVAPPPGAFLQATMAGETILAELVGEAVAGARTIADLFCGIGTFALRLAQRAHVHAVDAERSSLRAIEEARARAAGLQPVTTEVRDLFRRPLTRQECARFEAVVFDPPRAGAQAQAHELAAAAVPTVVAVSCDVDTFARDAGILLRGGYALERVVPIDQFRHSSHLEIVSVFRRARQAVRRRRLLG